MIIFIHLPRTGGTFISQYARAKPTKLRKQFNYYGQGINSPSHLPASSVRNREEHYLFGLVRNPFDWYVSQYSYFADKNRTGKRIVEKEISENTDGGVFGTRFEKKFPTFKDWMMFGLSCTPNFWFSNLYYYMFTMAGRNIMNHIGKLETIYDDFDYVLKTNGLEPRVDLREYWGNRNASERTDYHNYYDEELVKIVKNKDKKILDLYKYEY